MEDLDKIDNGWRDYSKLVLNELKQLNKSFNDLQKEVQSLKTEQAVLRTKMVMYVSLASFIIAGGVSFLIKLL